MEEVRKTRLKKLNDEESAIQADTKALNVARLAWLHEAKLLSMQPTSPPEVLKDRFVL